ncbi:pyruvate kinase [Anaerosporobacter sp.]|uniref:pyruvate kinase n=1 Tax=Anaerosporobacter sp. TaxID=1872529 RepID=UPI00286F4562|nr:pyruvate kinase [Anaerosporobacter sp.]
MNKKTKIVCTMGPNMDVIENIRALAMNGMNVARLNFSHGDFEEHGHRIKLLKQVREELDLPIAILLDTKGPEIRTGMLVDDEKVQLEEGQDFLLTTEDIIGDVSKASISYENLPKDVKEGDTILIDDGLIGLSVQKVEGKEIFCKVTNGGTLGSRKGVNIPGVSIKLPGITEKDRGDILFAVEQGLDFIAASFVRNGDAIREIRKVLTDAGSDIAIVAKIENEEGIQNIDEIIELSDAIMVARGDLGVEIPAAEVPFIQKMIIKKCNDACVPVITATQMLDSMIRNPRPTRAEVTDVANAIYDGTDAIMLSGETAMGKYPVEALQTMVSIAVETEAHIDYEGILEMNNHQSSKSVSSGICYSAVATASSLNAKVIAASSYSGYTARMVSKLKPQAVVLGLSPLERTLRKMQLFWGVVPVKVNEADSTDDLLDNAVKDVKEKGFVENGDVMILTAGLPAGKTGVTNMIKAVIIED